jgi:hypothetical protein
MPSDGNTFWSGDIKNVNDTNMFFFYYIQSNCIKRSSLGQSYLFLEFGVMVFNVTFNNISVILWRSVLLVEETTDLLQVVDKLINLEYYRVIA